LSSTSPKKLDTWLAWVVSEVRAIYGNEPWFKGVCLDGVREFWPYRFDEAVEHAANQTFYWDGLNYTLDNN
jgi:hypothetical protein